MRLHLKNISPEVHGMIVQHKASHNHKNLDETVSCLIKQAMQDFDRKDKCLDNELLSKYHINLNDMLRAKISQLEAQLEEEINNNAIIKRQFERIEKDSIKEPMVANG